MRITDGTDVEKEIDKSWIVEKQTEAEKWANLEKGQKIQYFRDYYLVPLLTGIAIAILLISLIWHFAAPEKERVLYVALLDERLNEEESEQLQKHLEEMLGADGKQQTVLLDDAFYSTPQGLAKLQVYLSNHQIDVIIAEKSSFEMLAGYGYLENLEDILEETYVAQCRSDLFYAAGYREADEISFEDNETGRGEILPYGLNIKNSEKYEKISTALAEPVIGVAKECKNPENAIRFLKWMME